ncbi:MAG: GntR family transcriptional regulator [Oscillospiraceae bacterium]|nr:GntR family transcriptional regulator [Oscillospiraceae bacterium]
MLPLEEWRMGFDERFPIYRQIVNELSRSLVRGKVAPGERIPSIRDMSLALRVNTNTVQRAYQELERNSIIFSQRGTGYFVMEDTHMIDRVKSGMVRDSVSRFLQEMTSLGFSRDEIVSALEIQMKEGTDNVADDGARS